MDFSAAMSSINYLAVVVSALAMWVLGALWYSPVLFANAWMKGLGFTKEGMEGGSMAMTFLGSLILMLVMAWVLALFLVPDRTLSAGAMTGAYVGVGWVATSIGINYLYERRPFSLFLINAGYQFLGLVIMGAILGAW